MFYNSFLLIFTSLTVASTKKLNVLFIFVDDLRPLSDKEVHLPNIRNLAASGVNFQNAFAQQALCAPSRNSLLTGRRPDRLHLYDFYSYWRHSTGNFTTLPQYFKENGYNTYSIGKVFHPGASSNFVDDYPFSWSKFPYHPSTDKYKDEPVCKVKESKKLYKNLICPVDVKDQPEHSLPDLQSLQQAKKILLATKNSSKPFFIAVGFHKPHIPFKIPREYLAQVPIENVKPPTHPDVPINMPSVAWHPWLDVKDRDDIRKLDIPFPMGTMPEKWTIKIRQSYYASVVYVDDLIGKLLKLVDVKKTVIVLTSDHGWSLGENGLWAKYSNFDVALKVPLIFTAPRLPRGKSIDTPVELLDVFPTMVKLAGLHDTIHRCSDNDKRLLCFDGRSLMPLVKNKKRHREFALSQYPRPSSHPQIISDKPRLKDIKIMGYSIRTNRYRYTEWIGFNHKRFTKNWNRQYGVELYDHDSDPEEYNNLSAVPEYDAIMKSLSKQLRTHS